MGEDGPRASIPLFGALGATPFYRFSAGLAPDRHWVPRFSATTTATMVDQPTLDEACPSRCLEDHSRQELNSRVDVGIVHESAWATSRSMILTATA
jgi:hypothetical protein